VATIGITNGVSTLDASGNSTPVSGQVSIGGSDNFGDTDQITDNNQATGFGEQDTQTDGTIGTDPYTIALTQTPGGTTFNDQENINETLNDSGTLQQDGGGTSDTGSMSLSGPIQASLQQAGSSQGGQTTLGPTNGNDQVNLTGRLSNTTDVLSSPGTITIVSTTPAGHPSALTFLAVRTQPAVENVQTVLTDAGWREQ
jgi:hypothetical protein